MLLAALPATRSRGSFKIRLPITQSESLPSGVAALQSALLVRLNWQYKTTG